MPIQDYILTVKSFGANAEFKLRYNNGRFKSLELLKGKLVNQLQHESIMKLCPQLENAILILEVEYKDKPVHWEKCGKTDSKTLYRWFLDKYVLWYEKNAQIKAKIDGVSGNALKSIIVFLKKSKGSEQRAKDTWSFILETWESLPNFYKNQMELRQINSNINVILRELIQKPSSDLNDEFKKHI